MSKGAFLSQTCACGNSARVLNVELALPPASSVPWQEGHGETECEAGPIASAELAAQMVVDRVAVGATSLRDQFAMAALQGLLAGSPNGCVWKADDLASSVFEAADAMMKRREQVPG